jgi:hypothetical protein
MLLGIHQLKKPIDKNEKIIEVVSDMSLESEGPIFDENEVNSLHIMKSLDESEVYYFGIIDILTNFK